MPLSSTRWPLGVFSSVDAGFGVQLEVAHELGVPTIQLHAPLVESRTTEKAEAFLNRVSSLGIEITCVFAGFEGESYADMSTVVRTVGLIPLETRAQRVAELKEIADFAKLLGVDAVGLHIGFVPHDTNDPDYTSVIDLTRDVCDYCAKSGQAIHLETGQEPANVLLKFIQDVDRKNLFINFDPANMILYGCGEPLEALVLLSDYVRSVHCKDGNWSDQPGVTWGEEVPLGEGQVNMEKYLQTLAQIGYTGPLTIEREISQEPERQKAEIGGALALLTSLREQIPA